MELDKNGEKADGGNERGAPSKAEATSCSTWADYALIVSSAQGYQLDPAQLVRVAAQLELISAIAAPLLDLQLPAELEPAPVFRP
jgi:hypothetical protein